MTGTERPSEIDELAHGRRPASDLVDAKWIERQGADARLTSRERIVALLEPGSFREIDSPAG